MRVLHLMDSADIFGAEVMLLTLAIAQRDAGTDARIGSIQTQSDHDGNNDPLTNYARLLDIPVDPVVMPARAVFRGITALNNHIGEHAPDLIHSHGYKANILLACLKKVQNLPPIVTTLHGWTVAQSGTLIALYEKLDRWALGEMDHVVTVTQTQMELEAIRKLPADQTSCIENGTDINWRSNLPLSESERVTLRELDEFVGSNKLVLAIGRLAQEKGHNDLLQAFGDLVQEDDSLRLIIAGEGPTRNALEQQIQAAGIDRMVRLPGYLKCVDKVLDRAACLIQPSLTEGLPITLLEAMGKGVPIVATRVGGMPTLLENGAAGTLIQPGKPQELQLAIENIINNQSDTGRKSEIARALFESRYSALKMAERYQGIYEASVGKLLS